MSFSPSVVVLFSDISRALYRVLVSTFPEINLLFMGRGTSQAQQHHISVTKNRWQSCKMNKGGAPSGQRAATQKRLQDKEEEETPDAKTQREEVDKEAKRNFFSRHTAHQSLPNIDIEMSGEPSATPVFTTTTTPVQDPLLAFEHPPKKPDHRVDGQVYIHKDGLLKGVRVKWSVSSKTYFCTCDTSVHDGNCETRRCPLLTGKRTCASAEVSQTVEEPTTRLAVGVSFSKATINNDRMQLDPGHLQSLTSIQHIPACSETKSPAITILQKGTWSDTMLQMPSWSGSIVTTGEPLRYPFRVGAKWRREIKGGKYAEVVNKAKVTVIFEIKLNAKTPETPVFSVRDYDEGVFAREFTAHSFSQLAMLWLTQNGQTGVTLAALNGKKLWGSITLVSPSISAASPVVLRASDGICARGEQVTRESRTLDLGSSDDCRHLCFRISKPPWARSVLKIWDRPLNFSSHLRLSKQGSCQICIIVLRKTTRPPSHSLTCTRKLC